MVTYIEGLVHDSSNSVRQQWGYCSLVLSNTAVGMQRMQLLNQTQIRFEFEEGSENDAITLYEQQDVIPRLKQI